MTLTLVKNPKFAKRVEYTTEQKRDNFAEFYKLANKVHKLRQFGLAKNKEDLHWKDEMYAVIDPKDFNKFADAVAFVCGSPLEVEEKISHKKMVVYASGYWNCIGQ